MSYQQNYYSNDCNMSPSNQYYDGGFDDDTEAKAGSFYGDQYDNTCDPRQQPMGQNRSHRYDRDQMGNFLNSGSAPYIIGHGGDGPGRVQDAINGFDATFHRTNDNEENEHEYRERGKSKESKSTSSRDYKPSSRDHKSGSKDHKSGSRDHKSGSRDYKSGSRDHKSSRRDDRDLYPYGSRHSGASHS